MKNGVIMLVIGIFVGMIFGDIIDGFMKGEKDIGIEKRLEIPVVDKVEGFKEEVNGVKEGMEDNVEGFKEEVNGVKEGMEDKVEGFKEEMNGMKEGAAEEIEKENKELKEELDKGIDEMIGII